MEDSECEHKDEKQRPGKARKELTLVAQKANDLIRNVL